MKPKARPSFLLLLLPLLFGSFPACRGGRDGGDGGSDPRGKGAASRPSGELPSAGAWAASIRGPDSEGGTGRYAWKEVEVMESMPIQFALRLRRSMPSAGWKLEPAPVVMKALPASGRPGRLELRIRVVPPEGPSAMVLEDLDCRVPLGSLRSGTWELRIFEGESGDPVQVLRFEALRE